MENSKSNSLILITGIIAGAAAVYFLKSPKGKEIVSLLFEKGEQVQKILNEQTDSIVEQSKEIIDDTMKKGEEVISDASKKLSESSEGIKDNVNDVLADFDKGIEQAKSKLNQEI